MKDALIISVLSAVPKNLVARWMGLFGRTRFPAVVQRLLLRAYVAKYGPNLDECLGRLEDYESLTAFFTRALKPEARPVDALPDSVVSPVDGVCSLVGDVIAGRIPQAPDIDYALADLLGERFGAARFAVLYLSPKDYHRVHTPREGRVTRYRYLPGRLWPVFPAATRTIRDLFARNERLVSWIDTDHGTFALVMVGAFGVGRIRTVYCDVVANSGAAAVGCPVDHPLGRGDELGRFELGSTVILVVPPNVRWEVEAGQAVRLGQRIGSVERAPSTNS